MSNRSLIPAGKRVLLGLCILAALLLPLLSALPPYWFTLLNTIGLASIVTIGLALLTGVGGMTSFGQAAFVGCGAYASALLTTHFGWSPWMVLPVVIVLTALLGLALGLMTVQLSGHYLPLATIAWGISIFYLFGKFQILGANSGLSGLPPFSLFGFPLLESRAIYPLILVVLILVVVLTLNLLDSRTGRAIRAMRSGMDAAESFGINARKTKLLLFVYAAVLAGVSGWLYAHFLRAVTPGAFTINVGIEYLLMAVMGGTGHVFGAILGSGIVVLLKNALQNYTPDLLGQAANIDMIVFGGLLILLLQFSPDGLWHLIASRLKPRSSNPVASTEKTMAAGLPARSERPAAGQVLLEVNDLRKQFGGLVAVNDLSFRLKAGEIVGLLGPNGAGKSTTFDLLSGVSRPTSGSVNYRGEAVETFSPNQIAACRIARTFQHVKLVPEMTVLENAAIGAHLRGSAGFFSALFRQGRAEDERMLAEARKQLVRVGLGDMIDAPCDSLALGQQRIVEIARALCLDPDLLLLDEPAAGLRHNEKQILGDLLSRLREDGITILLVEHDMDFVMRLTNHLVVMDFGTKIAEGTPAEIQANQAVIEAYLGVAE